MASISRPAVGTLASTAVALLLACDPCTESCDSGWTLSLVPENDAPLADGTYDIAVTPDDGEPLQGTCTVSNQNQQASCTGSVTVAAEGTPDAFDFFQLQQTGSTASTLHVTVQHDGATVLDEMRSLDYDARDSCDTNCKIASESLALPPA